MPNPEQIVGYPLTAGGLTRADCGRRVKIGPFPVVILEDVEHSHHGYTTVWMTRGEAKAKPYTVASSTPATVDPPEEVTGG